MHIQIARNWCCKARLLPRSMANNEEGCAFAEIYKGKDAGGYFVNRKGEVLGKFQSKDKYEGVWEPGFHLFFNDGKWGYCHQFSHKFSGCIYHDIRRIDDFCIEVSIDGKTYQKVTC